MLVSGKPHTPEELAQRRYWVVVLTRGGMSAREIGARLGVAERTVNRDRIVTGVARVNKTRPPLTTLADIRGAMAIRRRRVIKLTRQGLSARQIGERLGVTKRTVERDRAAPPSSRRPPPPGVIRIAKKPRTTLAEIHAGIAARREQVVKLTREGMTAPEIGERLNIAERTVNRDRVKMGVGQPMIRSWTDEEQARAETLLADGASLNEVARTLGRHRDTIGDRFRGRGWTAEQTGQYNKLLGRFDV